MDEKSDCGSDLQLDSRKKLVRLRQGLATPEGNYSTASIFSSEVATDELCRYVYTLKTFVGNPSDNETGARRKWVQARWVKKISQEKAWAANYISHLTETDQLKLYDEAVMNVWSRDQYWANVDRRYREHKWQIQQQEPPWVVPPIEAYDGDAEAQPWFEDLVE